MDVALVAMTRCPPFLVDWVRYHVGIGICRIYLRLEGARVMEAEGGLAAFPEVVILERELYPMGDQMDRQCFLVAAALERARLDSMDLLLHIDDDELFYAEKGLQEMIRDAMRISTDWDFLHFSNIEALYPPDSTDKTCFWRTEWFHECSRAEPCRGYGNGKSMARVGRRTECFGVHYFSGTALDIPPSMAVILHFESCDFDSWRTKFGTSIPSKFPFYTLSHEAVRQCEGSADRPSCEQVMRRAYEAMTSTESQPSRVRVPLSSRLPLPLPQK
jgi:hypothetical protein